MPAHKVPAEPIAHAERALQVDAAAWLEPLEIRAAKRFGAGVEFEQVFRLLYDRKAAAVDSDAVADLGVLGDEGRFDD
jgi:hypothetical protein